MKKVFTLVLMSALLMAVSLPTMAQWDFVVDLNGSATQTTLPYEAGSSLSCSVAGSWSAPSWYSSEYGGVNMNGTSIPVAGPGTYSLIVGATVIVITVPGPSNPTYTLTVNSGTGGGNYTAGTSVPISANAAPSGQTFDKWTGDVSGVTNVNDASTTFTMGSANATVTATYKALPPTTYTLTVNSGTGGGSYTAGTSVPISANAPPAGQTFDKWTGDVSGVGNVNDASTTYTMGSTNATVTATYKALPPTTYTLTVNNGTGGGSYTAGTSVSISANAAPSGQTFDKWTGDVSGVANVNDAITTFTMGSANATVTATYKALPPTTYTLTVNSGTGSGSYTAGTSVPISANAAPSGQTFDKWTGDVGGVANVNNASTTFTMGSANATVTATYKALPPTTYTLTVNNGTGSGSYTAGTSVPISADAAPSGQTFDKWTGDVGGVANVNNASTTFTMGSANATVTATYKALPPTNYTVTFDAKGGTPNPASQTVEKGGLVTEPTPPTKADSIFLGWYYNDVKWNFSTDVVNESMTLVAKWLDGTAIRSVNPSDILIFSQGGNLIIKSESTSIMGVMVYNLSGQLLKAVTVIGNSVEISTLPQKQMFVVKIEMFNGEQIIKKVLLL